MFEFDGHITGSRICVKGYKTLNGLRRRLAQYDPDQVKGVIAQHVYHSPSTYDPKNWKVIERINDGKGWFEYCD